MPGRELAFKLYIEGIEVPFVNANISATANASSQMSVTMVPSSAIWDIRPRSLVHMFFLDDYIGPEPDGTFQAVPVWRLLWEGEAVGLGYNKSPNQRNVSLQCIDLSNYWDYTQQYFVSSIKHGIPTVDRRLFFGTSEVKFNIIGSLTRWYERFLLDSDNLAEAIVKIIKFFTDGLVYWETLNTRVKLSDKTFAFDDDRVEQLVKANQLNEIIGSVTGQIGGRATIMSIINHLKELIYYIHVPIVAPPFRAGGTDESTPRDTTTSFLFKPNIYMTAPPRCNVLFPDQISSMSYSRSFLAEPTRLWLSAAHTLSPQTADETNLFQAIYYAPAQLREVLNLVKEDPNTSRSLIAQQLYGSSILDEAQERDAISQGKASPIGGSLPFFMTEEEYEKGIIPLAMKLPFAKYSAIAQDNAELKRALQQVAEYQLQLARFTPRTLTVTTEFNPFLVVSFPCAVFDASRSYFGNIVNLNHHIDSTGGSYTMISCNMSREMLKDDEEIPTLPKWLNSNYHPGGVSGATGTYRNILGCDAMGPNDPGPRASILRSAGIDERDISIVQDFLGDAQFDLAKVADELFQLKKPTITEPGEVTGEYDLVALRGDTYEFAREFQRRNIATIEQVFGRIYGLGVKESEIAPVSVPITGSGTELAGSPELENTVFDYRPRDELAAQVITRRRKNGKLVGNLTTAGHKREPIARYVRETTELRGIDGS